MKLKFLARRRAILPSSVLHLLSPKTPAPKPFRGVDEFVYSGFQIHLNPTSLDRNYKKPSDDTAILSSDPPLKLPWLRPCARPLRSQCIWQYQVGMLMKVLQPRKQVRGKRRIGEGVRVLWVSSSTTKKWLEGELHRNGSGREGKMTHKCRPAEPVNSE